MQLCGLQRAEDFEVVFEHDLCGPFSKDLAAILEAEASDEPAAEEKYVALEEEAVGGARAVPNVREPADRHGDTTESSDGGAGADEGGGGDDDGARAAASPVPLAGSDSDSADYRDKDLERDAPPPVSSSHSKSPEPDVVEQIGGGARVVVEIGRAHV